MPKGSRYPAAVGAGEEKKKEKKRNGQTARSRDSGLSIVLMCVGG